MIGVPHSGNVLLLIPVWRSALMEQRSLQTRVGHQRFQFLSKPLFFSWGNIPAGLLPKTCWKTWSRTLLKLNTGVPHNMLKTSPKQCLITSKLAFVRSFHRSCWGFLLSSGVCCSSRLSWFLLTLPQWAWTEKYMWNSPSTIFPPYSPGLGTRNRRYGEPPPPPAAEECPHSSKTFRKYCST